VKEDSTHCANKGIGPEEKQLQRQILPVRHPSLLVLTKMRVTKYIGASATNLSLKLTFLANIFGRSHHYEGMQMFGVHSLTAGFISGVAWA
jgi:hypothetical protein